MSEYLLADLVLYALAAVLATACILDYRRHLRLREHARKGLCPRCGYSLTGNVSGVCPECGTRVGNVE